MKFVLVAHLRISIVVLIYPIRDKIGYCSKNERSDNRSVIFVRKLSIVMKNKEEEKIHKLYKKGEINYIEYIKSLMYLVSKFPDERLKKNRKTNL